MIPPVLACAPDQTVYVVDDDSSTRELLAWLMHRHSIPCQTFAEPRGFLEAYRPERSGCLILDLNMPGMSGLELQTQLNERGLGIPVIFLSGRADVSRAVAAVRGGAFDFIEKPFDYKQILQRVGECLERDRAARAALGASKAIADGLAALTHREREVMERVVAGEMNREIAESLEISIKTVEAHRSRIMEKLHVDSVVELVQAMAELRATGRGK
ncbi:MAG: response regulator [Usitatibacter sp.]